MGGIRNCQVRNSSACKIQNETKEEKKTQPLSGTLLQSVHDGGVCSLGLVVAVVQERVVVGAPADSVGNTPDGLLEGFRVSKKRC